MRAITTPCDTPEIPQTTEAIGPAMRVNSVPAPAIKGNWYVDSQVAGVRGVVSLPTDPGCAR